MAHFDVGGHDGRSTSRAWCRRLNSRPERNRKRVRGVTQLEAWLAYPSKTGSNFSAREKTAVIVSHWASDRSGLTWPSTTT